MEKKIFYCLVLLLGLTLGAPVSAGNGGAVLTVNGTGIITVKPDIVTILVGVDARAKSADLALGLNAERMNGVMAILQKRGVKKGDIQTRELSLNPLWKNRNTSYDKPLEIIGFTASNVVWIRLHDLDLLGPLLDALTRSGANRIQNVQFGVSDPKPYFDRARVLAVKEAMRKARLYADAAGQRLGGIISLEEGGATRAGPELRALSASLPVAGGELSMRADVRLRVALRP